MRYHRHPIISRVVRSSVFLAALLLAVGVSCKKTEKGQSAQWDRALKAVEELKVTHPGFKNALDEVKGKAQNAMDAARELTDEEARIEAMAAANRLLTTGFVGELRKMDEGVKKVRKELVDLAGDAVGDDEKRALEEAKKQVEKSLATVESTLERAVPDAAAARALVGKAKKELEFAEKTLKQVTSRISKNKREAAKDKANADEAQKAADEAEKAKTAPWTCSYCDHQNPHDASKCSNCGAERGK